MMKTCDSHSRKRDARMSLGRLKPLLTETDSEDWRSEQIAAIPAESLETDLTVAGRCNSDGQLRPGKSSSDNAQSKTLAASFAFVAYSGICSDIQWRRVWAIGSVRWMSTRALCHRRKQRSFH